MKGPVCALAASVLATFGQQPAPVFRASADAVLVDVSVLQHGRPVHGLGLHDFAVWDNDVRQALVGVSVETMPLDLTLVVDISQSLDDPRIAARTSIRAAVDRVSRLLRPDETLQLLALDSRVRRVGSGADLAPSDRPEDRQTALLDALLTAAMQPASPLRRRLVLALTDGVDTLSATSEGLRQRVADRAAVVVHVVSIARSRVLGLLAPFGHGPDPFEEHSWPLRDVIDRTGGRLFIVGPNEDFIPALQAAMDEFRVRYMLRYTPTDDEPGWHALRVAVIGGGRYDIRYRRGYWRYARARGGV